MNLKQVSFAEFTVMFYSFFMLSKIKIKSEIRKSSCMFYGVFIM